MNKEVFLAPVSTEHTIYSETKGDVSRIILLLHGYLLDGAYILRKLKNSIPENCLILAPNGPFVVPVKKRDKYEAKYAWYFFDPYTQNYYVNFEPAAEYLKNLVKQYNPKNLPITIVGYSQGGYLSPKVAEIIPEVDRVIGLACVFRNNRFQYRDNILYHQINSKSDLVVEFSGAEEEFRKLQMLGNRGKFIKLKESGHKIDSEYLSELNNLLK